MMKEILLIDAMLGFKLAYIVLISLLKFNLPVGRLLNEDS